jgi:hypothetical protein
VLRHGTSDDNCGLTHFTKSDKVQKPHHEQPSRPFALRQNDPICISVYLQSGFQDVKNTTIQVFYSILTYKEEIMEHFLKSDLHSELLSLEKETKKKWSISEKSESASKIHANKMVDNAWSVVNALKDKPYLSGKNISAQYDISRDGLAVIYKMIQRSKSCQTYFAESKNRDYFNVVNHYFNHQLYTLVFFVGTTCPSRCVYCPNVKVDKQGRRRLLGYGKEKNTPLNEIVLEMFLQTWRL